MVGPVIPTGAGGGLVTEITRQPGRLVLQLLLAVTHTLPGETEYVTEIVKVPCPVVIIAPVGTVQLYVDAPATEATE